MAAFGREVSGQGLVGCLPRGCLPRGVSASEYTLKPRDRHPHVGNRGRHPRDSEADTPAEPKVDTPLWTEFLTHSYENFFKKKVFGGHESFFRLRKHYLSATTVADGKRPD